MEDLSRDMMRQQFEINVFGAIELTNIIIPVMRKQGYGRIIFNTSILGMITMPYRGAYNASKFALEAFGQTLRQELYGTGISVSMMVPGPIHSELRRNALKCYENNVAHRPSQHRAVYERMEKYFFAVATNERKLTASPAIVVKYLLHAIESSHPKIHYYIRFPAKIFSFLRRILPDQWLHWLLRQITNAEIHAKKQ